MFAKAFLQTVDRGNWDSFVDGNRLYEKEGNRIICTDLDYMVKFTYEIAV